MNSDDQNKESQLSQADKWLNNAIDPSPKTEENDKKEDDKPEEQESKDGRG